MQDRAGEHLLRTQREAQELRWQSWAENRLWHQGVLCLWEGIPQESPEEVFVCVHQERMRSQLGW